MTQQQYLDLKPLRHYLDQYVHCGSARLTNEHTLILLRIHQELFSSGFNTWCDNCGKEAFFRVMVEFDKYEQAGAPVILTSNQEAKTETNVTKRSRKRNTSAD